MGDRLRVLVVDDEEIVGRRLKPALEKVGLEVETCLDGTAAIGNSNGVFIADSSNNTIGGVTSGSRNIISGHRPSAYRWVP